MSLTVYNTLSRKQEEFITIEANKVLMYCCGMTVYDYCHLGHARTCIIWDVVRRYLEWKGYDVNYVQNFTDIDDKIINRAKQENSTMAEVSERYIEAYFEDMERLNVKPANSYPRATYSLDGIKNLIWELQQKKYAYASEGDVYYAVDKFENYGKLSGRKLEDLKVGASGRIEVEDTELNKKQSPFDFALWKSAKNDEPYFESIWGKGRPGWHIECSAMVKDFLGDTIDIHVGGSDLIFPHHENEIAQSEAFTNKPLARYWLHNGMVKVEGEKMSKSLGNFITIRDLLTKFDPMAVRLFILQANYRKPLDFTDEALQAASNGWETLKEGLLFKKRYSLQLGWENCDGEYLTEELKQNFQTVVDDDFNFSAGLAILFDLAKELRKEANILIHEGKTTLSNLELQDRCHSLISLAEVLGFEVKNLEIIDNKNKISDEEIEELIKQRIEARKAKNYVDGDRLRDILEKEGITLIDSTDGVTKWHRN